MTTVISYKEFPYSLLTLSKEYSACFAGRSSESSQLSHGQWSAHRGF